MSAAALISSAPSTQCRTLFGSVALEFAQGRLCQLYFTGAPAPLPACINSTAAQQWLSTLSLQSPASQWRALDPPGSEFQRRVWRALLQIPFGQCVHYRQVAEWIGQPTAARAVGSAIAANPICLLIPCHRVVPIAGGVGQYRWGAARKQHILRAEAATSATLTHFFQ